MAYCSNCGQFVADGVKFCSNCGSPMNNGEDRTKRQQEFAGKIIKCPACGTEIPSFTAICPGCGHEINSARVSTAIKDFTNQISQCDRAIANSPAEPKKGWKSWSGGKKVGWVFLNLFTFCIPLVIYLILPLLGIGSMSSLTPEEKNKAQLINNFAFPNDRENILEGLLYIKSQTESLASGKIDRNTWRWIKIWKNKASQLFERAEMMFKGDKIANDAYTDILASEKKVKKSLLIRVVIAVVVVALFTTFVFSRGGGTSYSKKAESPTITENAQTDDSKGIYTYQIRNYVGKNLASVGKFQNGQLIDEYGSGDLRIIVVSENGMLIPADSDLKKEYTVVAQNLESGTDITVVHLRDSRGKPYSNLVDYQSYDELILYVSPVGEQGYVPQITSIQPTLDRHIYHVRDYVGRNAASFGEDKNSNQIDEYGHGEIRIVFTSESGAYVDAGNLNELKKYIVVGQDIDPNTELKLEYETNSRGEEYDNLIRSQNYEEINLTVRPIDESIVSAMPDLETASSSSNDDAEYTELAVKYKVISGDKAEITGFSGDGNHATINRKIDGHEVVGIGDKAFQDCTTLESVLFWADVKSIGDYAFSGCTALKEISIPNETTYIGKHAFDGCTNLSDLIIWGNPEIDDYAFCGCESITDLSISQGTKRIGTHAFDGCKALTSVIVWDDDTIIEKDAFANCPNLKDRPVQE